MKRSHAIALVCIGFAANLACKTEPPPPSAVSAPALVPARAFRPAPFTLPLPPPGPGDWLAEHPERGQTFEEFLASDRLLPNRTRRVIYLQPIGVFSGPRTVDLERLRTLAAAFFQLPVVVREPIGVGEFTMREHPDVGRQLNSSDVLRALKSHLPPDAYCMLGVTMEDLYPSDVWNFVFGQASLSERVGVFSFARYSPTTSEDLTPAQRRTMTQRAFKVLTHETGHMFGIKHCTAYRCGMNGSNGLAETDRAPLAFCPVCLQKLQSSIGFDVAERDAKIAAVLADDGLDDDAQWYLDRRAWILGE